MTLDVRSGYTVTLARLPEDASGILRLWGAAFPALAGEPGERKLRTMYADNPAGTGTLLLLHAPTGGGVGVMGLGRRAYRFGDRTIRGGTMADLAVVPKHRALGPALILVQAAVAGSHGSFDFLCGFPNQRSEPVFVRAGYTKLTGMIRYGRPLRSARYVRASFRQWWGRLLAPLLDVALWLRDAGRRAVSARTLAYREADGFDASFDSLWAVCSERPLLMAERSRRALTWYFAELAADRRWRVSTARAPGGELEAYVVWRVMNRVAQVADFLWSDATVGRALLERIVWSARKQGCTSVSVEFSGDPCVVKTLRDARFRPREDRPVYYVPGDLPPENTFDEWYLTGFDRDAL